MKKKKFNLSGPVAIIVSLLVLVVFVPINLIVSYYDKVYDMTPNKRYTFNDKTVALLDSVSDKEIEVYYLSQLSYLQDAPEYLSLYHTLTQLDERDNITLKCFDPDKDAALAKTLDPTGILGTEAGDVFVKCGDTIKRVSHTKIFQTIDGILNYAGEELIAGAIKVCTDGSLPTIYFLTGHGEKSIGPDLSEEDLAEQYPDENVNELFPYAIYARQLRANNYAVEELDLDEAGAVPDNTAIIYIAGPTSDITSAEKDLLIDYLANEGSVSMLLPPCDTEGKFTNLDAVLAKFGLEMDYNIVTESSAANKLNDRDAVQNDYFFRVSYVPKTDDFTQDLTTDLITAVDNGAYTAGISNTRSLTELPDELVPDIANIEKSPLIYNISNTDGDYTTVSKSMGGDKYSKEEADENLSGIGLEFGYYSYNIATGGKLFVLGTADVIDATKVSPSVNGTTQLVLFSNTWLRDTDIQMGIGNKLNSYDSMHFNDAHEATTAIFWIVAIPVCIALIGVIVWLKRRHA